MKYQKDNFALNRITDHYLFCTKSITVRSMTGVHFQYVWDIRCFSSILLRRMMDGVEGDMKAGQSAWRPSIPTERSLHTT